MADHIHLLIAQPLTCAPSELVQEIKTGSSKWLKTKTPCYADFHWQSGYGISSICPSHRPALEQYIANQADHHRTVTFHEEYRRLLDRYNIDFDERYVWQTQGVALGYHLWPRWGRVYPLVEVSCRPVKRYCVAPLGPGVPR